MPLSFPPRMLAPRSRLWQSGVIPAKAGIYTNSFVDPASSAE